MMEAVRTSETSVNSYQSTQRYSPGDSHLPFSYLLSLFVYLFKIELVVCFCDCSPSFSSRSLGCVYLKCMHWNRSVMPRRLGKEGLLSYFPYRATWEGSHDCENANLDLPGYDPVCSCKWLSASLQNVGIFRHKIAQRFSTRRHKAVKPLFTCKQAVTSLVKTVC
jgi:hypothetical protein